MMWCDDIQGWLRDEEKVWLWNLSKQKPQLILEIGSFAGKSAFAMAESTESVIVTLDGFKGNTGTDKEDFDKIDMSEIKKSIIRSIEKYKVNNIISIPLPSTEVIKWWHQPIDGLFIDGEHTIEGMNIDGQFINFVKPRGWIAFHDCGHEDVMKWINKNMTSDKFKKSDKVRTIATFFKK